MNAAAEKTRPAVDGARVRTVLVVRVDAFHAWNHLVLAAAEARPGQNIRVVVVDVEPPAWGLEQLRRDLNFQVECDNPRLLRAWADAIEGVQ